MVFRKKKKEEIEQEEPEMEDLPEEDTEKDEMKQEIERLKQEIQGMQTQTATISRAVQEPQLPEIQQVRRVIEKRVPVYVSNSDMLREILQQVQYLRQLVEANI